MEDLMCCSICCINFDENVHIPRQFPCQHIICQICLPYMKKIQNDRKEYIECPTCRGKHFVPINSIPKSLVMIQLIENNRQTLINQSHENHQNITCSNGASIYYRDQPPSYNNVTSAASIATREPKSNNQQNSYSNNSSINQNSYNNNSSINQNSNNSNINHSPVWDQQNYVRNIFSSMDLNNDGSLTSCELQQALRQTQAGSEFSLKTVELLITKYDKNGDREIEFSEFSDLFNNLNEEFANFLMMDSDESGIIDLIEFETAFTKKNFNFSHDFFKFIMHEIHKKTGVSGLKFDNYIRVMARFDFLCQSYRNTPYFHKYSLEHYLKKTFFQDFW